MAKMKPALPSAYLLGRLDDDGEFIAHIAVASPAGTKFAPLFHSRRAAVEYRNLRLEMPKLKVRKFLLWPQD